MVAEQAVTIAVNNLADDATDGISIPIICLPLKKTKLLQERTNL